MIGYSYPTILPLLPTHRKVGRTKKIERLKEDFQKHEVECAKNTIFLTEGSGTTSVKTVRQNFNEADKTEIINHLKKIEEKVDQPRRSTAVWG